MDEAVRDLVFAPFADIADKAKAAVENAKEADNPAMLKAAQNLVREGDRAVKKLEPLCKKHLDEFASNFVDALKENGGQPNLRFTPLADGQDHLQEQQMRLPNSGQSSTTYSGSLTITSKLTTSMAKSSPNCRASRGRPPPEY